MTTPERVTAHHIRSYIIALQDRGLADASVHAFARAMRAFCNFLVREELLDKSPMRNVQMPRMERPIKTAFTPAEVKAVLKASETTRDTAIVLALLDTGCRASEFVGLNIGDLDLKTGAVTVRHGKGRKHRVVFMGAKARKSVLKYLMERDEMLPNQPLWPSFNTGERLTDWGLRIMFKRIGGQAQVEHCNPHTFRRTFALWSLRAGMNIYALQQIMGHSDLSVLRQYLALVEEDLHDAHQRFGAVDNML